MSLRREERREGRVRVIEGERVRKRWGGGREGVAGRVAVKSADRKLVCHW